MESSAPLKLETVLTDAVVGVPDLNDFVFELNGRLSAPLTYEASEDEVASAVLELFTPKCPAPLGEALGNALAYK